MFWKKKNSLKTINIETSPDPQMMMVPFLFGIWQDDPVWRQMRLEKGHEIPPPSALLFIDNYLMIRCFQVGDRPGETDDGEERLNLMQHLYQADDAVMTVRDYVETKERRAAGEGFGWGDPYERKWYITKDLGFMLERHGNWDRFLPSTLEAVYAAGFSRTVIEGLIADYREAGSGFIETFTAELANPFIDARLEAELDGEERPRPPVQ
jgi:hypothetical protein